MSLTTTSASYTSVTSTASQSSSSSAKTSKTSSKETSHSTTTQNDTYSASTQNTSTSIYTKPTKLTAEQLQSLQDAEANSKIQLIQKLTASLTSGQSSNALIADASATSVFFKSAFCSYGCELPALATDPQGAQAAISEGGAYSVDSVATRIMDLATALAGSNPSMLAKMRSAVEKGFGGAASIFSQITGQNKLPQICQDTYKEVMNRFDKLQNQSTEPSTKSDDASTKSDNVSTEGQAKTDSASTK